MIDLTKGVLPDTVKVAGKYYHIHTEHYYWFRFAQLIKQKPLLLSEVRFFYIDNIPEDEQEGFHELQRFFYEPHELPRSTGEENGSVLDYELDADLIYAAVLEQYGIDLVSTPMHWHKVRALIAGLHDTKLTDIIGYRCYSGKDADFNKLKRAWQLPQNENEDDALGEDNTLSDEDIALITGR